MRNHPTILLLILFTLVLIQKVNSQTATVTPDKLNVFYKGCDNPITVVVENCSCKDIIVNTSVGYIAGEGCHYHYEICDSMAEIVKIFIGVLNDSVINWIDTIDYRLKKVPDPTLHFSGQNEGVFDKELLLDRSGIIAQANFCDDLDFFIIDYSVKILRDNSVIFISENIENARYKQDFIEFVKNNCKSNDDIIFYDIIVWGRNDCFQRKLNNVNFKIK